ncbi:photosynthetic complex putative assembly protein PuhB [Jannaschia sp. 2305UL9-9]|uniref:photosynthetic complex putative assembly protein PuhB n=1 Tax=Jannaschia sp. 2305UL9-9 TaxID=3121638 RepID=UPI003526FEF7
MSHDDFDNEPIRGLPQMLPAGEHILWQGAPDWRALAVDSLKVKWVAGYFIALFGWRAIVAGAEMSVLQAMAASSFYLVLGAVACSLLALTAWIQAKTAVYTITNRRVILRIGAALTMTLQFPFNWIGAADLVTRSDGTGTIALRTLGETRFSYLLLWPHLRPWRMARTQPALRCIPDAAAVARLLAEAVADAEAMPRVTVVDSTHDTAGAMPVPAE